MARELGIRHASASYHLRQLEQAGLIEAIEGNVIRGGRERLYRQRIPDDENATPETWSETDLRMVIEALYAELTRRSMRQAPGSNAVIDGEFWVPPETWRQVRAEIRAAGRKLHAAAQPANTPGAAHVSLTALLFQISDEQDADGDK